MSEHIDDATRLSDMTQLSDATHLSDVTHVTDIASQQSGNIADQIAAEPSDSTSHVTAGTPSTAKPNLPQRPSTTRSAAVVPASNDHTAVKPQPQTIPALPHQSHGTQHTNNATRTSAKVALPRPGKAGTSYNAGHAGDISGGPHATGTLPPQSRTQSQTQSNMMRPNTQAYVQSNASAAARNQAPSSSQSPAQSQSPAPAQQAAQQQTLPSNINSGLLPQPTAEVQEFQRSFTALVENISQVVIGKAAPIKQCVTALMVGGHVLLEDNPGTGKTQLARGLANSIDTSFKRIQFTPDLLPSDVVGVTFYDQKRGEFEFREGPIFASIVLADEINRASPKTQSALLEVMEEQKVTVDGVTHDVPQPFIVIATQNPIEQLGTYKLPEAQMDRFLIKTSVGYPGHDVSVDILKQIDITDRAQTVSPVLTGDEVMHMRQVASGIYVDDAIREYIVRLVEATRHNEKITVGASMRGALALTRCARIWAAADGRAYVVPDDVKDLALPVLAHRITLTAEATFDGATAESLIAQILDDVPAPTIGA
ncbi:AAA family ATPase [Bifidobacterium olomucense]|uniref:ATPase AAA n=1 Tax=Bifidobacterium olomucense TaxID=2675324 RepID=A0A7Y0HXZ9_9BIFI|nr:MoxR family ATPase [Bifidobacterium sp. DSM 109959]NMM98822.1 ATPase AAA [Bifidobacterium sp. DSM 109959]